MKLHPLPLAIATCVSLAASTAMAQQLPAPIAPVSTTIIDAAGNPVSVVPVRVYGEAQYGAARSKPGLANSVDYRGLRFVVGADFVSPGPLVWGVALGLAGTRDDGRSPFATIETEKQMQAVSGYFARPILPNVAIGANFGVERLSGQTIYNSFDVNNETGHAFDFSPFLAIQRPLGDRASVEFRPSLVMRYASYNYDLNIPPTAETSRVSLQLPVTLSYELSPDFTVHGSAAIEQVLSEKSFDNVPAASPTTLILEAGAEHRFDNGYAVYGSVGTRLFDENYESVSAKVGVSYAF